jgi:4-amino-4-deoxy-L-arabinose transferase-like glycosyltransferase
MVALFSIATDYLIYHVGKRFFTQIAGLTAAALYAVSPLVITYSHSSWNPDVLPFFALLFLYFLYKADASPYRLWYILFGGFLLGLGLQLHYLAVLLGVSGVLYIAYINRKRAKMPFGWKTMLKQYLLFCIGFIGGFSPFIAFEIRHGFPNTKAIFSFIFTDTVSKAYTAHTTYIATAGSIFFRMFARLLFDYPTPDRYHLYGALLLLGWGIVIIGLSMAAVFSLFAVKNKPAAVLMGLWLFAGVFLFGMYKSNIYDYLFTFVFPLPFLLTGNLISYLYEWCAHKKKAQAGIVLSSIIFISLFVLNISDWQFRFQPNRQKQQTEDIAAFVISKTDKLPYNFALLSLGNSDYAYRYYLTYLGDNPVVINNPQDDPGRTSVTSQLLIVCEDMNCKPLGDSLFDVAAFGRGQITGIWHVSVVKVFRLVHYKSPPKT